MFGQRADEFVLDGAVDEQLDRRNSANTVASDQIGKRVRVDLDEPPRSITFSGQLVECGAEDSARSTPRCPEINEHGLAMTRLDDILLEVMGSIRHSVITV